MKSWLRWARRLEFVAIIVLVLVCLGFWWLDGAIKPTILSIGEARAQTMATSALFQAVYDTVGDMSYEDLVDVRVTKEGKVNFLQMNTGAMNRLAAKAAINAQTNMAEIGTQSLTVPLFTAIGSQLFMGSGPLLHLQMLPVGTVSSEFRTEFVSAGINQTRHRIFMTLHGRVRVVIPNASQAVDISAQVLVAESVIVGDIPQWYSGTPLDAGPLDLTAGP